MISRPGARALRLEPFEERILFTIGPSLAAVIPAAGTIIPNNGTLHTAPTEIDLKFDKAIDPTSLTGGNPAVNNIQFVRGGDGIIGNGNDVTITPAYYAISATDPTVVVARFASALPSDAYQITIIGAGSTPLKSTGASAGPFNGGTNQNWNFTLDLGAQVVSVVPQPVTRGSGGALTQATNEIDVYFDTNDPLNSATATNPANYELIRTAGTATTVDDVIINPSSPDGGTTPAVTYNQATGEVVLRFGSIAGSPLNVAGSYRLRVGNSDPIATFATKNISAEPGSSFSSATASGAPGNLGSPFSSGSGTQTVTIGGPGAVIGGSPVQVLYPGSNQDPGSRLPTTSQGGQEDPLAGHTVNTLSGSASNPGGNAAGVIPVFDYNFQSNYGSINGQPVFNAITPTEETQIRNVFSYYAHYLGVEFVETPSSGFTIAVGDLRVLDPLANSGPNGQSSIGAYNDEAIINASMDWTSTGANTESFFATAMNAIGLVLGLGFDTAAPPGTVMSGDSSQTNSAANTTTQTANNGTSSNLAPAEPVLPGQLDILHGQYLLPPVGNDVNVYQFSLASAGQLSLETFAQRLAQLDPTLNPSQLDTVLTLYDANGNILSRNDNYYGDDSFISMSLPAGQYYIAVSSTGNINFNPVIAGTGFGGTTEGAYQLRMTFTPTSTGITNATGTPIDGDSDGSPGGVYNFWFTSNPTHTVWVDKSFTGASNGSITNPYANLAAALAAATPGGIVRIEGNGGADGNLATLGDDLSYNIGFDNLNRPLSDGTTFQVPRGVTVMVDAGAILKLRGANISVGSSSQGIDFSGGSLQMLGTPTQSVYVTSYYNSAIGTDSNTAKNAAPAKGDWGGIVFNDDSDNESQGIFNDYVNHANITYGGGQVSVNSVLAVYDPINLVTSRPTISYNTIANSADSAMSADPNSFQESEFQGKTFQADYTRVGPNIHGNTLSNNSINGLFIRIRTQNGESIDPLTVSARLAATDIVYVLDEALEIQGLGGGLYTDPVTGKLTARLNARLTIDPGVVVKLNGGRIETEIGAQFIAEGTAAKPIIFTSLFDRSYGAGGTFDTNNDIANGTNNKPAQGNWGGLFFGPLSIASIDHAVIEYGGGATTIEGGFDTFDVIEIHQAQVRIANSFIANNQASGGGDRNGRTSSTAAIIFVRGAQPVIVNNTIENNDWLGDPSLPNQPTSDLYLNNAAAISIDVNSLNSTPLNDYGRSTGPIGLAGDFPTNDGPLVHGNLIGNNPINGMVVRGGMIDSDVVMDDTDIVHVVLDRITTQNQNSLTGTIKLESSSTASLVVKFLGTTAGIQANGELLDTTDRIGGSLQVIGQPNHPVVLTSLLDASVGAGLTPSGQPGTDTYNLKGTSPASPNMPPNSVPTNTGPIIVDSANLDAHGSRNSSGDLFDGWVTIEQMLTYLMGNSRVKNPANPNTVLVVLNQAVGGQVPGYAENAIRAITAKMGVGVAFTSLNQNGSLNLQIVNFADYPVVYIPSDFNDVDSGLQPFDAAELVKRSADLRNYVNNQGGALLCLAQDGSPNHYDFIGPDTLTIQHTGGNVLQLTNNMPLSGTVTLPNSSTSVGYNFNQDGPLSFGLPWLNDFVGPNGFDGLQPWAVDPGNGQVAILGLPAGGSGLISKPFSASPGDWQGIQIGQYANDTNLAVVNESEQGFSSSGDTNATPSTAQFLGTLAPNPSSGDDNDRLGFDIHGSISQTVTSPGGGDVDVYSFTATAGTDVWFDITQTAQALDSVVELVDSNGTVLAQDDNALNSSTLKMSAGVNAQPLSSTVFGIPGVASSPNFFSVNPLDAGMQVVLPGTVGQTFTYYVRVRASNPNLGTASDVLNSGLTKGAYDLQIRLQNEYQFPGSVVQYADVRDAINGVSVIGKPDSAPELGNGASVVQPTVNIFGTTSTSSSTPAIPFAEDLGNLLASPNASINAAGNLTSLSDVNLYKFELNYPLDNLVNGNGIQTFAAQFQIDFADGLSRPDTTLAIYNSQGQLILVGRASDLLDGQPRPGAGADTSNTAHGQFGNGDPTVGSVQLPAGSTAPGAPTETYYVAVSSSYQLPDALAGTFQVLPYAGNLLPDPQNPATGQWLGNVRLEPVDSVARVVEDHADNQGSSGSTALDSNITTATGATDSSFTLSPTPYSLGDVVLFVNTTDGLAAVDPFTGGAVYPISNNLLGTAGANSSAGVPTTTGQTWEDIAMRSDGRLMALTTDSSGPNVNTNNGIFEQISTADGTLVQANTTPVAIADYTTQLQNGTLSYNQNAQNAIFFEALDYAQISNNNSSARQLYAVGSKAPGDTGGAAPAAENTNLIFALDPDTGAALNPAPTSGPGVNPNGPFSQASYTTFIPVGHIDSGHTILAANATQTLTPGQTPTQDLAPGAGMSVNSTNFYFNLGTVIDLSQVNIPSLAGSSFEVNGQWFSFGTPTVSHAGNIVIAFSPTESMATLGGSIKTAINNNVAPQNVATFADHRVGLVSLNPNGTALTATQGAAFPDAAVQSSIPAIPTAIPINLTVEATAAQIAQDISNAIALNPPPDGNSQNPGVVTAVNSGPSVTLTSNGILNISVPSPLATDNAGLGGISQVTGMATLANGQTFAVTNTGAVFQVVGLSSTGADSAVGSLLGIHPGVHFTGLTAGPPDVEGGAYKNTLFATDSSGNLYALKTDGSFAPVLLNGATHVQMDFSPFGGAAPAGTVEGLAFSTLDYNLWHQSNSDTADPTDHGINPSPDLNEARDPSVPGNTSVLNPGHNTNFYFGLDAPNQQADGSLPDASYANEPNDPNSGNPGVYGTYQTPGGALGSLTSSSFSLAGYTTGDQPTLYFDYALGTTDQISHNDSNYARDTLRVFASADGVNWTELATNNQATTLGTPAVPATSTSPAIAATLGTTSSPELPKVITQSGGAYLGAPDQITQPLFSNAGPLSTSSQVTSLTAGWRQARVDLSDFAGDSNVQLRFDFSTAGSMGSPDATGSNLVGTGNQIAALPGNQLHDGDQVTIAGKVSNTGSTVNETFTFRTGQVLTAPLGGAPVQALFDGETFKVAGTTYELYQNLPAPTLGGPIGIQVTAKMSAADIASAIYNTVRAHLPSNLQPVLDGNRVEFPGVTVSLLGNNSLSLSGSPVPSSPASTDVLVNFGMSAAQVANALVQSMDATFAPNDTSTSILTAAKVQGNIIQLFGNTPVTDSSLVVPAAGGSAIVPGEGFEVGTTLYEMTEGFPAAPGFVGINVTTTMSAAQVANAIFAAVQAHLPSGVTVSLSGNSVRIHGTSQVFVFGSNQASGSLTLSFSDGPFAVSSGFLSGDDNGNFGDVANFGTAPKDPQGTVLAPNRDRTNYNFQGNGTNSPTDPNIVGPNNTTFAMPSPMGARIDNVIIGLAGRGEMVTTPGTKAGTNAPTLDTTFYSLKVPTDVAAPVQSGVYQLTIQRGTDYAFNLNSTVFNGDIVLDRTLNLNDRETNAITLIATSAAEIMSGPTNTFTIGDNFKTVTYEFLPAVLPNGSTPTPDGSDVPIYLHQGDSASTVASEIASAIMMAMGTKGSKARASTNPGGDRVDLFTVSSVDPGPLGEDLYLSQSVNTDAIQTQVDALNAQGRDITVFFGMTGDTLQHSSSTQTPNAQGETLITNTSVTNSRQVGILVTPYIGQIIDSQAQVGVVEPFRVGTAGDYQTLINLVSPDTNHWVGGVSIVNNLVVNSGQTGIFFSGDPNTPGSYAVAGISGFGEDIPHFNPNDYRFLPTTDGGNIGSGVGFYVDANNMVPFGRIVNNTVYGDITGVAAVNGSSPTIINNVVAASGTGKYAQNNGTGSNYRGKSVFTDGSSGTTVIGTNIYQNNVDATGPGTSSISLQPTDPLFVDAANNDFYLKEFSQAIDSSTNSLPDRSPMQAVEAALGIAQSPILAPNIDLFGQLRVDDPSVASPPGFGSNVFKDRGALERADFVGPTATLVNPVDNDSAGLDRNPALNTVLLVAPQLTDFAVQFLDGVGVGVDDASVAAGKFLLQQTVNGTTTTLQVGTDYNFNYDSNTKTVHFVPLQGVWGLGTYTITLNNSTNPIIDLAGNPLQPNNASGTTQFTIQLVSSVGSAWQNPTNKFDVNNSGGVSPIDALLVIDAILAGDTGPLPNTFTGPITQFGFVDVNGDGMLSSIDALQVIQFLNGSLSPSASPHVVASPSVASAAVVAAPGVSPSVETATSVTSSTSGSSSGSTQDGNAVASGLVMSQSAPAGAAAASVLQPTGGASVSAVPAASSSAAVMQAAPAMSASAVSAAFASDDWTAVDSDWESVATDLAGDSDDNDISVG